MRENWLKRLAKLIHEMTIERAGTLDPWTGIPLGVGPGYLVSLAAYGRCFKGEVTIEDIYRWLLLVQHVFTRPGRGFYIGVWTDEDGDVWLDISIMVGSEAEAIAIGHREFQRCIFDRLNQTLIYLPQPVRRAA